MSDFGSGVYLHPVDGSAQYDWDFDVDETGDIRTTSDLDELMKDVAFSTARAIQQEIGGPIRPVTLNRIDAIVTAVLEAEPRIDEVIRVEIEENARDPDRVDIQGLVNTDNGTQELVFSSEVNT